MNITINISSDEIEALVRLFRRENIALPLPTPPLPTPEESAPDQPKKQRGILKATPLSAPPIRLSSGNVDWRVEIDGLPVHWRLDYPAGKLPATRGSEITWQGERYRVSHIYGTSLKVTSLDADTYQAQGHNGLSMEVQV